MLLALMVTQIQSTQADQEDPMKDETLTIAQIYYGAFIGESNLSEIPMAESITFTSPRFTLNGENALRNALANLFQRVKGLEIKDQFHDGSTILTFYHLDMGLPGGSIPMAERLLVRNGKLAEIDLIFDSARMPVPKRATRQKQ